MPYIPHVRITTRFSLGEEGAPKEQASCTLNFNPGASATSSASVRQQLVNDAFDDWAAWIGTTGSRVSASVKLDECRLYVIGTDGHITEDPAVSEGSPVRGIIGTGTDTHPWQVSVVLTLVAGVRGLGRFGRIYLPPMSFTMKPDGTINDGHFGQMFESAQSLMAALSDKPLIDAGWGLRVAGRTGSGTLREVTELRMGHVADTQRRRRRSLAEGYSKVDFDA